MAGALLALVAAGCGEFPDPGSLVVRYRVVGVRTELEADPSASRPGPGEGFAARPLVVAPLPSANLPVRWRLEACPAGPDGGGVPDCAGPVRDAAEGTASDPSAWLRTEAPSLDALHPDAPAVLLRGVLCTGGLPVPADGFPRCAPGSADEERFFSFVVVVDPDDPFARNRHPSLADATVTLDGAPWEPPPMAPEEGCAAAAGGPDLPRLAPDETRSIGLRFEADEREPTDPDGARELLQLSHLVTAGEVERWFSVLEGPAPPGAAERIDLDLTAPDAADVPPDGRLVRKTLVARDGRGGLARLDRAYCVVPPG